MSGLEQTTLPHNCSNGSLKFDEKRAGHCRAHVPADSLGWVSDVGRGEHRSEDRVSRAVKSGIYLLGRKGADSYGTSRVMTGWALSH
jgi:hypothetical protein